MINIEEEEKLSNTLFLLIIESTLKVNDVLIQQPHSSLKPCFNIYIKVKTSEERERENILSGNLHLMGHTDKKTWTNSLYL